jgi:flagellar motor switch/type III secretory pathway protein FliN
MPSTGDVIDISAARIRFPDLNVHCVFAMWQEGRIVMESERAGGSTNAGDVPVRIDLGSVELSAADIADLRRGSKLELEAEGLLRCFLRIGNRTFAEGALSVTGDGLTVTVQKILQD